MIKVIVISAVMLGGWAVASPYVVSQQIKSAAEHRDGAALSEHIEFPTLRQNVKAQLKAAMVKEMAGAADANSFVALGAAFGSVMIEGMVNAFVTPASITEMIKGEKVVQDSQQAPVNDFESGEAFKEAALAYETWGKFSITVRAESGEVTRFVLQRRGLSWKLTNIIMPI